MSKIIKKVPDNLKQLTLTETIEKVEFLTDTDNGDVGRLTTYLNI
ncbi:hypothetical protein [Nitrosopumilus ureiphilus]|nr:hypothetical protein [Nitrosopumilus ureiphilus]